MKNFKNYCSYFHDGIVQDLNHFGNKMTLTLESAELWPEWNTSRIPLSKRRTVSGILHIENINKITINDKLFQSHLIKTYDDGNIYDLEIQDGVLILYVSWENYPPKKSEETDVFKIQIEAEKIYWENLPSLTDKYWENRSAQL